MIETLSVAAARRIALTAQGFGQERPLRADQGHLRRAIDRLSLHQIDSVNVVAQSPYMPPFLASVLMIGGYPTARPGDDLPNAVCSNMGS